MARLVLLKDAEPLVIRKGDLQDDEAWICRCGLSAQWPLCDSSHALARREEPGKTYRYHRTEPDGTLQRSPTDEDTTSADPRPAGDHGGA